MKSTRYEDIETRFWTDPDFERWGAHVKLLFLYLITSPLSHGITGIYPVTERQIRAHTNLKPRQIGTAFASIGHRVRRYEGAWVWVVKRFAHQCTSPNHYKGALAYLKSEVPAAIVADFVALYANSDVDRRYGLLISTLQGATKPLVTPSPTPAPLPAPTPTPTPLPSPTPSPAPRPSLDEQVAILTARAQAEAKAKAARDG